MWKKFNNGLTLDGSGSESGIIVLDEEHPAGARITMESDGHHPFSITCGIYGVMVHTVFASSRDEAETQYRRMKERIEKILNEQDDDTFYEAIKIFTNDF